jgi:hypothetical protein
MIVWVLAAVYVFYVIRGLGRAVAALTAGLPVNHGMLYKVLPTFDVFSDAWEMAPSQLATLILAGPGLALLAGYLLLGLVGHLGRRLPSGLLLFLAITSYACLVMDPIYYALIPLMRLGGEPETLARVLDIPRLGVALPAMALLGLNVFLTRRNLVPLLKSPRRG